MYGHQGEGRFVGGSARLELKYTDNLWEAAVSHRELYSMVCGDLNGKETQNQRRFM